MSPRLCNHRVLERSHVLGQAEAQDANVQGDDQWQRPLTKAAAGSMSQVAPRRDGSRTAEHRRRGLGAGSQEAKQLELPEAKVTNIQEATELLEELRLPPMRCLQRTSSSKVP